MRLTEKSAHGRGYAAPGFYGLEIDDVARLQYNLSTAVECRIRRNGSYDIISTVTP